MKIDAERLAKLVKLVEMSNRFMYEEPCIKMEKEASAEQKKEIEDTIEKNILKNIKTLGIEAIEAQIKVNYEMGKTIKKTRKLQKIYSDAVIADFNRRRKSKSKSKSNTHKNKNKRAVVMSCRYSKEQGNYINHSE
jgi:hypothetical protein